MSKLHKKKSLLILSQNVSGMNKFLFSNLERNWEIDIHDIPYPKYFWLQAALRTVHPDIKQWKQRHFREHLRRMSSAKSFRLRSKTAQKIVGQFGENADVIFQISGTYNGICNSSIPGALFLSFATLLAYNEWRPWAAFKTEKEFQQWFEYEKLLYQSLDINLCTNEYVRKCLIRDYGVKPERTAVIGYGVNFDELPQFEKKPAGKRILFVGYDFERKGGLELLKAFGIVRKELPDAVLQIVGPAILPVEPVPDGVEFYGTVNDRQQVADFFRQASFFAMPSLCEPFGLALLEAMAYKNPCIGSTNNAMPEIISDGETGYTVPPGDIELLADRMLTLLKQPDLCLEMGMAAFRRVQTNFTWKLTVDKINRELMKLLSG